MTASPTVNDILSQARQLAQADQLTLLQRLAALLKRTETSPDTATHLTSLAGLGSELWKSTEDIDRYIAEERQW